ncbi:Xaa-Pro dipeptidyl-peptidase [Crossiella sp. CA-258035]|uniref:Xaa-Pro dipeptidyl-peptidase n=1 Tax=Crossiella sp. CA-258035 TaxID=2981138 RepID=UPI0024BCD168|nr:Xaa-Pro dipeptidyl-peptidase [Crossiella sp. CA-258035]WHT17940.1 Xaa-Pro dipeptidyl-peptidase [Crossiella sp. CA-258035]
MRPARTTLTLLTAVTAAFAGTLAALPATAAPAPPGMSVVANETQPIYSHAEAIRETVYIESAIDSDSDGKPDRIAADVMRPKETNTAGLKSPVVMEASPYYRGTTARERAVDADRQIPGTAPRGFGRWYDEFFVPRGYAVVEVEMQGTSRSAGCPTTGGKEDTASIAASIDWLNGRKKAFYADGKPAVASWSTGAVGMLGVSYNGTLPNAVATAGIEGLKTIVPIAAISSWYDYTRDQGIGYSGGWDRRYPEYLANYVASAEAKTRCAAKIKALGDNAGDNTFDYTPFWQERDYRPNAANIKASVFVVHGQEDWNVKPGHYSKLWYELVKNNIPRKIWLHRGAHLDPIGFRQAEWQKVMHKWMDHWLVGLDNGVMKEPMADIQRPNGAWETHSTWPQAGTADAKLYFGPAAAGAVGSLNKTASTGTQSFTNNSSQTEATAVSTPETAKANRLAYLTAPLAKNTTLSGTTKLDVTVTPDSNSTPLTAVLVDYGPATTTTLSDKTPEQLLTESCEAADLAMRTGCAAPPAESQAAATYQVVTKGSIDVKNHASLKTGTALTPGTAYRVRFELHPKDYVFPAGHRIGVVLVANLSSYVSVDAAARGVRVSLANSSIDLPLVGGGTALGG